jgi:leucyl-tRNA synthetase
MEGLDWPSDTMTVQKQWIGKSTGCQIVFDVEGSDEVSFPMALYNLAAIPCLTSIYLN